MIRLLVVPLLFVASLAAGTEFSVLLPQQSSITFVSKQMNVPVEGSFRKFTAQISVDPTKPETGKARIELDLASIDTGNTDADEEVAGKAWFDSKNNPIASFTSESINSTGKGQYQVTGKLTIKGKALDAKAPFTLRQAGGVLLIEGAFPLKRLDFNIGSGIWGDTSVVADEVQIRFSFTVAAKK
ncbi:MAG: YceI family protein [Nitrosomonadales bacterium]|nr:YceI family protein [Nitrosomonadales bacterium]